MLTAGIRATSSTEQPTSPASPVVQSVPGGTGFSFGQSSSGVGSAFGHSPGAQGITFGQSSNGNGFTFGQSSSGEGFTFGAPPISAGGIVFDAPPADEQEPEPENWHFVTDFAVLTVGSIILICLNGEWVEAEVMNVNRRSISYKILGEGRTKICRDVSKIKHKRNS